MHYSAKRGLAIACRLSVCGVGGSGPIARTILAQHLCSSPKTSIASIPGMDYGLQIWPVHSQGPSEQKPIKKNWEKREGGRIQGLPKFLEYPLLSLEWVKLQTPNFVRTFIGSIGTKAH